MRSLRWLAGLAALTCVTGVVGLGCESIGGIADLEIVECVSDCGTTDASVTDTGAVDSGAVVDSSVPDTTVADSGTEAAAEAGSDADATLDAPVDSIAEVAVDTGPADTRIDCTADAAACPTNFRCLSGTCILCGADTACGDSCGVCPAGTPKCLVAASGITSSCVQCLTKFDCGTGLTCSASGTCVADGCALPADACTNGGTAGKSCDGAIIIGRSAAKTSGGFKTTSDTCSMGDANNNDTACAGDGGFDKLYRIFLRKGEKLTLSYASAICATTANIGVLKLNQNTTGCGTPTTSSCTGGSAVCSVPTGSVYTALSEGWYTLVADSGTAGAGVSFTLTVKLDPTSCQVPGCECP